TQSNTPSPTTQPSTTSQSNPSPTTQSSTQSTTQPTSQNPTHPSQTSVNNNQQPQQNPIAAISKVIGNLVSVLESLFSKI
ncbi:MAG: hypothetical protein P4K92_05265, partial [Candidatus Nitrosotalea sp.]|nr:hypothetical protein [Candidatus Nitrosotalea sp.]